MPPRVLLTGAPGVGKTTLVRRVVERLGDAAAAGFVTEEVRGARGRTGFRVVALDGRSGPLASAAGGAGPRVGRYAVHLDAFEAVALPALALRPGIDLFVVDEIGKMECLSASFVEAVRRLIAAEVALFGTVARAGGGLVAEAKRAPGVEVVVVTPANRDALAGALARRLRTP